MMKIEAIIRHHKLEAVKSALQQIGVAGVLVTEVRGCGRQKGHLETYRGVEYLVDLLPKIKVELVAQPEQVATITQAIIDHSRTGEIGDGKIFVYHLANHHRP